MFSKIEFGIVSNLRFISMKIFVLSWVEHVKSFLTSGPGYYNVVYIFLSFVIIKPIPGLFLKIYMRVTDEA